VILIFIFLLIHYSRVTYQIMARLFAVRFLSAVRVVAARCKRPFALRPGLSQESGSRTKGMIKEKRKETRKRTDKRNRLALSCGRREVRGG